MENRTCSLQTLRRLPYYLYYLRNSNEEYCSATTIARDFRLNEVQVRKDLAIVSKTGGSPRKGFNVQELISDLEDFLGYNNMNDAIIVGVGHLGKALINYKGFQDYGINIVMGFDRAIKTEMLIGSTAIFPMERMKNLVQRLKIKLGIITVNQGSAQRVCNQMIDAGIKAIWNFSPYMLRVPEDVLVQNENMAMSLAILSKHLNEEIDHEHQPIIMNAED
ncbi:MAG: redox-sensing transcriptional repressor Rex [Thermotogota bacterium]|nr:redox-sensing transcriptional repressor Rex [Thermotogota bacterium]